MINANSQRTQFDVVISDSERCKRGLTRICDELSRNGFTYYAIAHDMDTDNNGVLKRCHYHIVLTTLKRLRVKQLIKLLTEICLTNDTNIQVQEVVSLVASVQYLVHLNDLNKFQYDVKCVMTNNVQNLETLMIESPQLNELTTKTLLDYIFQLNMSRLELINAIGIGKYTHYRNTINDLLDIRASQKS